MKQDRTLCLELVRYLSPSHHHFELDFPLCLLMDALQFDTLTALFPSRILLPSARRAIRKCSFSHNSHCTLTAKERERERRSVCECSTDIREQEQNEKAAVHCRRRAFFPVQRYNVA